MPWLDLPDVAAELPGVWASDTGSVYAFVSNLSAGNEIRWFLMVLFRRRISPEGEAQKAQKAVSG